MARDVTTVKVRYDLEAIKRKLATQVEPIIHGAAEAIKTKAQELLEGPKSGRVYRRRGGSHQASAPGEAPAVVSRDLIDSITTEQPSPFHGKVIVSDPKAELLNYGTPRIAARPFIEPAIEQVEEEHNRR